LQSRRPPVLFLCFRPWNGWTPDEVFRLSLMIPGGRPPFSFHDDPFSSAPPIADRTDFVGFFSQTLHVHTRHVDPRSFFSSYPVLAPPSTGLWLFFPEGGFINCFKPCSLFSLFPGFVSIIGHEFPPRFRKSGFFPFQPPPNPILWKTFPMYPMTPSPWDFFSARFFSCVTRSHLDLLSTRRIFSKWVALGIGRRLSSSQLELFFRGFFSSTQVRSGNVSAGFFLKKIQGECPPPLSCDHVFFPLT